MLTTRPFPPVRGSRRLPKRLGRWLVLLVAVVAGLQPGCRAAAPTGDAEWIWPETGDAAPGEPAAYVLLSDFDLPAAPEAAAHLFVTADQEYAVHLNGHQMARGSFRRGEPIDEYQVAHLLRAGTNRLAIEVRTPYGDGGALAGIELADGSMAVATGADWLFTDRWQPQLVKGEIPLDAAREAPGPVRAWGKPPVGRWGTVRRGRVLKAEPIWRAAVARRIVRVSSSPGLDVPPRERASFRAEFGREVHGVLELEFRPPDPDAAPMLALCHAGACRRRPLLPTGRRAAWRDSASRTFDTVVVYGIRDLRAVRARS